MGPVMGLFNVKSSGLVRKDGPDNRVVCLCHQGRRCIDPGVAEERVCSFESSHINSYLARSLELKPTTCYPVDMTEKSNQSTPEIEALREEGFHMLLHPAPQGYDDFVVQCAVAEQAVHDAVERRTREIVEWCREQANGHWRYRDIADAIERSFLVEVPDAR